MPTLQKIPGVLTVGEAEERLKNHPDDSDPQIQQYKQSMVKLASLWQPRINADIALARTSALGVLQDTSLLSSMRILNESVSKMFFPMKIMMDSLKSPYFSLFNKPTLFGEGLASLGFGSVVKEATEVVQKHNTQLDKIFESINRKPFFEEIHITHLPESPSMRMARIEGKLDRMLEADIVEDKASDIDPKLLRVYPADNRKYKAPRNILTLLMQQATVEMFYVAKVIDRDLTKKQFSSKEVRKRFELRVENVVRGIRRKIGRYGYSVSMKSGYVELVETKN